MYIQWYLHIWWVQAMVGLCVGGLCGCLFFHAVAHSVEQMVSGDVRHAIVGQLFRMILLTPVLVALALYGATALLAATAGLTLARQYAISNRHFKA